MADKKTYYKLDETGIVGTQKTTSAAGKKYHEHKTSAVFRTAKEDRPSSIKRSHKKV